MAKTPAGPASNRTSIISGRSNECAWRLAFAHSTGLTGMRRGRRSCSIVRSDDGGWPHDRWGRLPSTCLALLFLRKANLAFEIDRVLRLPGPKAELALAAAACADPQSPPAAARGTRRRIRHRQAPIAARPRVQTTSR